MTPAPLINGRELGVGDTVVARNRFGRLVCLVARTWGMSPGGGWYVTGVDVRGAGGLRTVRGSDVTRIVAAKARVA